MDYAHLAILMMFIGLALLIAEIFVPSGGMISVLAAVAVAVAIWAAYKAWWGTSPSYWWSFLGLVILLVPVTIGGALFLLQRTSLGRRILLEAPPLDEVTPYSDEEEHLRQLVGKRGKTLTLLSPGGMVEVEGERLHCESPGMLIEAGEPVDVVGIKGNRLVVRLAKGPPKGAGGEQQPGPPEEPGDEDLFSDESLSETGRSDEPPLDFEVPRS